MFRFQNLRHDKTDRLITAILILMAACVGILAWSIFTVASATELVLPPPANLDAIIFEAISKGDWFLVAAAALSILIGVLRSKVVPLLPLGKLKSFLLSDRGGVVVTVAGALVGGVVHALRADVQFGPDFFLTVLKVAFAAMGGYVGFKRLFFPADEKPVVEPAK